MPLSCATSDSSEKFRARSPTSNCRRSREWEVKCLRLSDERVERGPIFAAVTCPSGAIVNGTRRFSGWNVDAEFTRKIERQAEIFVREVDCESGSIISAQHFCGICRRHVPLAGDCAQH